MDIYLVDINTLMTEAWKQEFSHYPEVTIINGSIFDLKADAVVSPAH